MLEILSSSNWPKSGASFTKPLTDLTSRLDVYVLNRQLQTWEHWIIWYYLRTAYNWLFGPNRYAGMIDGVLNN